MIQRFCFVKLLDEQVEGRSDLAELLRAQFAEAGADATVGLPADESAARWDLSIVVTSASLEAWTALAVHPDVALVFESLAARAAVVKAWTFESPSTDVE